MTSFVMNAPITTDAAIGFELDGRVQQGVPMKVVEFLPSNIGNFLGCANQEDVPSATLRSFWFHVCAMSPSMLAMLRKYKYRHSSGNEFLAILGDAATNRGVASAFLQHVREEDPAHVAALNAYNAGAWTVPPLTEDTERCVIPTVPDGDEHA
ncbi:hypothetical protein CYMTET_20779 [Cymbomonas tetramitiformis]|uniref:Uncharacterized protein n=1 Tax=Cymbomonas tetramitiformis TaxID=36881 RepID=A0AAE0G3H6_9CHLO|nr:hypothetical protein CYMTET_20779 [Cymbomonas tetramitiformis]